MFKKTVKKIKKKKIHSDDVDLPFVIIFRRRKNNNFISNSGSSCRQWSLELFEINDDSDDQVDASESDRMLIEQVNFVDQ